MKKTFTILLIPFLSYCASAQNLSNVTASLQGTKIIINYDLEAPVASFLYQVEVYSSLDQYKEPLKGVSGDVGNKVASGKGKKVEWQADKDISAYDGEVDFKLKTQLTFAPWLILNPSGEKSFKRGKASEILWTGYANGAKKVNVELQRNGQAISSTDAINNSGKMEFNFPKNLKTGDGYQIKIVNNVNANDQAISKEFKIKRKLPLVVKFLPIVILGGVAAAVLGGGQKSESPSQPPATPPDTNGGGTNDNLPAPPANP